MSFGKLIIGAFVFFGIFIGTLVTICVRQDINLVSKNYYQEELNYQQQVERLSNTSALAAKPQVKVSNGNLQIDFQQEGPVKNGSLKLFCPSDPAQDRNFELKNFEKTQTIDLKLKHGGMYRAKLYWEMNGKKFFQEEVIFI